MPTWILLGCVVVVDVFFFLFSLFFSGEIGRGPNYMTGSDEVQFRCGSVADPQTFFRPSLVPPLSTLRPSPPLGTVGICFVLRSQISLGVDFWFAWDSDIASGRALLPSGDGRRKFRGAGNDPGSKEKLRPLVSLVYFTCPCF